MPDSNYKGPERRREMVVRKWRWKVLTVWIILFSAIVIWQIMQVDEVAHEGQDARDALCVIYTDSKERIERTVAFLKENEGPFVVGFPRAIFEQDLERRREFVSALKTLDCP